MGRWSGDKTAPKKVITFQRAMTKKVVSFFEETNRVTPSVAAPGDTHPSDATMVRRLLNGVNVVYEIVTNHSAVPD